MVAVASRSVRPKLLQASELRRDRPLPTHDIALVYLDGIDAFVRKKISPELPVQRLAGECSVKACIKLCLPLNPRKRLVDAAVGLQCWVASPMEGSVSFCHERKTSLNTLAKTIIFSGALGWLARALQNFAGL